MFASEEAEEEIKRESAKVVLSETPSIPETAKEAQTPKPAAPTPEQILAIKVNCFLVSFVLRHLSFFKIFKDQHEKLCTGGMW